jgi:hypothetical protein
MTLEVELRASPVISVTGKSGSSGWMLQNR